MGKATKIGLSVASGILAFMMLSSSVLAYPYESAPSATHKYAIWNQVFPGAYWVPLTGTIQKVWGVWSTLGFTVGMPVVMHERIEFVAEGGTGKITIKRVEVTIHLNPGGNVEARIDKKPKNLTKWEVEWAHFEQDLGDECMSIMFRCTDPTHIKVGYVIKSPGKPTQYGSLNVLSVDNEDKFVENDRGQKYIDVFIHVEDAVYGHGELDIKFDPWPDTLNLIRIVG